MKRIIRNYLDLVWRHFKDFLREILKKPYECKNCGAAAYEDSWIKSCYKCDKEFWDNFGSGSDE